jgi:hypothetical protein
MKRPKWGGEPSEGVVAVDRLLYQIDKVEAAAVALRRLVEAMQQEDVEP